MKKLLAIILAAVIMLSMAACGSSSDTEDTSSNNKNEGTNNPTLVVDDDSLFMDEIEEHLAEYAKEDDQFEYELLSEEDRDYWIEWEFEEETGKKISGEIVKAYFAEYYDEEYDEDAELYIFEFEKSADADIAEEMFIDWCETSGGIYDYFRKGDVVMCGDAITIEIALEMLGIESES